MKRFKLLLMILCVSMMLLGFSGCNEDSTNTSTSLVPKTSTTPVSQNVSSEENSNPFSVPEPGTLVLLGSGLVGLAAVGRKKIL